MAPNQEPAEEPSWLPKNFQWLKENAELFPQSSMSVPLSTGVMLTTSGANALAKSYTASEVLTGPSGSSKTYS